MRSLDSYGPDYDFIYKTIVPIYHADKEPRNSTIPIDRQQLEQRCVKLRRKTERINAQREATVLHYYKSWIATKIAPPTSTTFGESTNGTTATTTNGKKTKSHIFAIPPTSVFDTPTTTRSGRTSKRPATMLLS